MSLPVLWSLSTMGDRWLATKTLMRLSVLPDESVLATGRGVGPILLARRVLRPLRWFGLLEYRDGPAAFIPGSWRKCALFDRFLQFATGVVRTEGALH